MKKTLSFLAAIMLCMVVNAQIVTSRSVSTVEHKAPSNTQWILRLGVGTTKFAGTDIDDISGKLGYNFAIDFNKSIAGQGAYWGMGLELGNRGYKISEEEGNEKLETSTIAHNIQWDAFNFGWKINLTDDIKLDPHLGAYVSYDYAGKAKETYEYKGESESESIKIGDWEDYKRYDVGMTFGIGLWYKQFNLDLRYQRGFICPFDYDDAKGATSNFIVRLGVAF